MYVNLIPAVLGLVLSIWLAQLISNKREPITTESIEKEDLSHLPHGSFFHATSDWLLGVKKTLIKQYKHITDWVHRE
jgi:hypothetical protein